MSERATEAVVAALAADAQPVRPLAPPVRRAMLTLVPIAAAGIPLVLLFGDIDNMLARYSGREGLMLAEMAAMLATALLAILGAFMLSVPGRSRRWLIAPLPAFAAWLGLSGLGCYQEVIRLGPSGLGWGHGRDCLLFLLGAGLPIGALMLWRLSRARPIDPLPVALLGGLAAAAVAALLLQFFHPVALTVIDLGVHFAAVGVIVALAALARRRTLAPA